MVSGCTEVKDVVAQIGPGKRGPFLQGLPKARARNRLALRASVVVTVRNPEVLDSVGIETVEKLLLRRSVGRGHL